MDPNSLTLGPLRVSTMVVTAHLGTTLNLHRLLELFHEVAIPLTWPDEGFLKVEYKPILATASTEAKAKQKAKAQEKIVIGTCSRDELTKRKKSKNIFFRFNDTLKFSYNDFFSLKQIEPTNTFSLEPDSKFN